MILTLVCHNIWAKHRQFIVLVLRHGWSMDKGGEQEMCHLHLSVSKICMGAYSGKDIVS